MVKIMIDNVDWEPAPKQLVLGSDTFAMIQKALSERLAVIEAQKELALSTVSHPAPNGSSVARWPWRVIATGNPN